ncbi:hypothetical protein A0K93_03030 [Corynebacterium sp. BCW_4722]|nr:hypothetical protein A0K93_03030 [Corynebacterium sp. BCW_4722]
MQRTRITQGDVLANIGALQRDIERLVSCESPSSNKQLLDECLDTLTNIMRERLGEPDSFARRETDGYGDVAVAHYAGSMGTHVLLVGHYDTVWPVGTLADWQPNKHPDEWSLPGIQDMKSGLVQGIWALKLLRESGSPCPSVTLLFNGDEELGSPGSNAIIREVAQHADAAFVLEALEAGGVKYGRKAVGQATVTATGVESHAGNAREEGASAIIALSEFCVAAERLNDPEHGIGVNVGLIRGGSSVNTVPGRARATIDLRHLYPEDAARIAGRLREVARTAVTNQRVRIEVDVEWDRPAMPPNDENKRLFELVQRESEALGEPLEAVFVGGGSDANLIADTGTPVLCGMGPAGEHSHARNEYISRRGLPLSVALLANSVGALSLGIG